MLFSSDHTFTFDNYGGSYQLRIESADDLRVLSELDEPFWMATSAPTHQLRCPPEVLALLDVDDNDRILSADIREACSWLFARVRSGSGITQKANAVELAELNDSDENGARLQTAARRILANIGLPDAAQVTLAQVRDVQAITAAGNFNGSGVITAASVAEDAELQTFIADIVTATGGATDPHGAAGVDTATLDGFLADAQAFLDWQAARDDIDEASLLPLGADTGAGHALVLELAPLIDEYFSLCRLLRFNESLSRATPAGECPADALTSADARADYLAAAAIAAPHADGVLCLDGEINPTHAAKLKTLRQTVVAKVLDDSVKTLDAQTWQQVRDAFTAHQSWLSSKSGGEVETLGVERLQACLDSSCIARLRDRIAADVKVGDELSARADLEKLLLLQQHLLDICNNFISFPRLYDPEQRAMFEEGRLVIDGRIFNLNFKVQNPAAHSTHAQASGIYLLYSEVTGAKAEEKFHIVTPITARRLGNLGMHKRGVLFDRDGKEWDTKVVKVVANPVSLWEALMAPFRKLGKLTSTATDKVIASREKELEKEFTTHAQAINQGVAAGVQMPQQPAAAPAAAAPAAAGAPQAKGNVFLTGSLAFAALGSSFAFISEKLSKINWVNSLVVLGVVMGIILIPVMVIAWLRLRSRNLSAILEASGWTINARMRLTGRLGRLLAPTPQHPKRIIRARGDLLRRFRTVLGTDPSVAQQSDAAADASGSTGAQA
jgi:hypothetical protein